MQNMMCADGRARGCFAFYGSHTGRFAGRGIQLQNLPRNEMDELAIVRDTVKIGNYPLLNVLYDDDIHQHNLIFFFWHQELFL